MTLKERQAEKLAEFIHCGQTRKNGEDYINHPRRVVEWLQNSTDKPTENTVCGAWLHDTQDYKYLDYIYQLIDIHFGDDVLEIIKLLSHIPKELPYNDYIMHFALNHKDALLIKFADMIDNTTDVLPERQFEKYRNACILLQKNNIEVPKILKERLQIL